MPDRGLILGRQ